jgi:uncharacterized membrane protein YhaH (DUF805 family)
MPSSVSVDRLGMLKSEMDRLEFHLFEMTWGAAGFATYHGLRYVCGLFSVSTASVELAVRILGIPFAVIFLLAAVKRLNDIGWSRWLIGPLVVLGLVALLPQELWVRSIFATPIILVSLSGGFLWFVLSVHHGSGRSLARD